MEFLKGLNAQQREAVTHTEGPLLILAGAGSGKTRVITHRIAHIICSKHVAPSAILAVTFTNKAAGEMRERVAGLLENEGLDSQPTVSTFHSFCVRLLRRDGDGLARIRPGFTRRFSIYDDDDQLLIIKAAYRSLGLDEKDFLQYRAALSRISHTKNLKQTPQDLYRTATSKEQERLAALFEAYEKALHMANALDFDDLLLEAVRLLEHDEATREAWNRRLSYVMIDEYQDTNRCQYELMCLLSQSHQNVCVVGDEDQSIYSWRGADIRNILDFERDFPKAKIIRLEQNYRSTKNILSAAGAVVENNKARKGKKLWTESEAGDLLGLYPAFDAENEALFIADSIDKQLASHPDDAIAVLYRTNFQSRQLEEALRRYGRKYNIVGGFSFYQRAEIKDTIAYLRLSVSTADSVSLLRVINTPARGIGRTTVEQIEAQAREKGISLWAAIEQTIDGHQLSTRSQSSLVTFRNVIQELALVASAEPLPDLIKFLLDRTGYRKMLEQEKTPEAEARQENLDELITAATEAVERGETVWEFLDHAALVAEADAYDEKAAVTLMTLHNAKGLEFPVVFIAGMELGLFPHSRSMNSEEMLEEERRLCYVGMTRAQKRLILSWAKYRRRFGGGEQERSTPSWFLSEIPENLLVNLGPQEDTGEVDLTAERYDARQSARRNTYTGKAYNSLENITQFFSERGIAFNPPKPAPPPRPQPRQAPVIPPRPSLPAKPLPPPAAPPRRITRAGMTVEHPKYGKGTVVRREGDGENAKITVNFPQHGLKKLVEKYAGLKRD
ncbi:MAG: UvrD-helicase domain-containing protein [Acidobacteriia bacterium]|nr:UvrD-helicase domain-containing protein [Terriglobia bacterium]